MHDGLPGLYAALMPLIKIEPTYRLGEERTLEGYFPLFVATGDGGWRVAGALRNRDLRMVAALNLGAAIQRSPAAQEALRTATDGPLAEAGRLLAAAKPN
jgi:hypothetical protein